VTYIDQYFRSTKPFGFMKQTFLLQCPVVQCFQTFNRGPHKLLQNSSRTAYFTYGDCFRVCCILSTQHVFLRYIILSLLTKCPSGPDENGSHVGFVTRAVVWWILLHIVNKTTSTKVLESLVSPAAYSQ